MTRWIVAGIGIGALVLAWALLGSGPATEPVAPPEPPPAQAAELQPVRSGDAHESTEGSQEKARAMAPPTGSKTNGSARGESGIDAAAMTEGPAPAKGPVTDAGEPASSADASKEANTPALLHGKVTHSNGSPAGPWNKVWLLAEGKEAIEIRARRDGTFAGAGIPPGSYRLVAQSWAATGMEKDIVLAPGARLEQDIVFKDHREIAVRVVTGTGKPIGDALRASDRRTWKWAEDEFVVIATLRALTRGLPNGISDRKDFGLGTYAAQGRRGEKRLADGRTGTLYVPDQWPMHVSLCFGTQVVASRQIAKPVESLSFTVDEAKIRKQFSGLTFVLTGEGPHSEIEGGYVSLMSVLNEDVEHAPFEREGDRITIRNRVPGRYTLVVGFGKELEDWERVVDLPAGEVLDLGTIHLSKATMTPILVRRANGRPIAAAQISVIDLERDPHEQLSGAGRPTDADGEGIFTYGPGRYFVIAQTPKGVLFGREATLPLAADETLELVEPPSHAVNVRLASSLAGPVRVEVYQGVRQRLYDSTSFTPFIWAIRLGDGDYTAVATEADGTEHRQSFHVGPDSVPTVFFTGKPAR